jgi:hypothetical protein
LKELYEAKGFSSKFLISRELINTTLSSCKNNLEEYLQKVKRLCNSLEARNLKLPDKFIAALVLNNLNKDYEYIVAIITQSLRSSDLINLDSIFSQILDESRRIKSIKEGSIPSIPTSNPTSNSSSNSSSNKDVEMSLNTQSKSKANKGKKCSYCNKIGHTEDKCFKKHPNLKLNKNNSRPSNNTVETEEDSLNTVTISSLPANITGVNKEEIT